MSTLADLIDDAGRDDVPTAQLLRRAKIVASRLHLDGLGDWVGRELDGYKTGDDLPSYRGPSEGRLIAVVAGPGGSRWEEPLPTSIVKPEFRDGLVMLRFWEPLAAIEAAATGPDDFVSLGWPADAVRMFESVIKQPGAELSPFAELLVVKHSVPRSRYIEIAATVRNRLLDVMLGLEDLAPAAADPGGPAIDTDRADRMATTIVNGGINTIAIADRSTITQKTTYNVAVGDRSALLAALADVGVPQANLDELNAAFQLDDDDDEHPSHGPGAAVVKWLGQLPYRLGALTANAAGGTVAGVATDLVAHHYGIS